MARWRGRAGWGRLAALLAALAVPGLPVAADPAQAPRRVVSINLCTDQLAMLLAAPGQLLSVSHLAQDPVYSAMTVEARAYVTNHGLAEEVYLLRPDLVVAGAHGAATTVAMLRRLGVPVVTLDHAAALSDVPRLIAELGAALGREAVAAQMIADFEAGLEALAYPGLVPRLRAATYSANSYTSGRRSLAADLIRTAGFVSIAGELGLDWGGVLPLETLVMLAPDVVIAGRPQAGHSRGEEVLSHPVLARLNAGRSVVADRDWTCGTPLVLHAAERLAADRRRLEAGSAR